MKKLKTLLVAGLLALSLTFPVLGREFEMTGLEFAGKDIVWMETDIEAAAYIALGDEIVALVAKTRSGRFEVLGGHIEETPDHIGFVVTAAIGWISDPMEAPKLVLQWLENTRRMGAAK